MSDALIAKLEPFADRIVQALALVSATATLQVVLHVSVDDRLSTPAIGFSPRVVAFLGRIGASIDIDTYRSDVPATSDVRAGS